MHQITSRGRKYRIFLLKNKDYLRSNQKSLKLFGSTDLKMDISNLEIRDQKKTSMIAVIIVGIIIGLIFAGLIQGTIKIIIILTSAIIKYWVYLLIGFIIIVILKRIFFRKKIVQPVRIVK